MSPAAWAPTSGAPRAEPRLERRPYPPGEHGRNGAATPPSTSELEKQKARFTYGLNERQFRNLYEEASRKRGVTGEIMLQLLERRLDNIVYRAGWASTGPQARQFVNHGHVEVNGRRVDIPSRVRKGDVVSLRGKARDDPDPVEPRRAGPHATPWLDSENEGLSVKVRSTRCASTSTCPCASSSSSSSTASNRPTPI